VTRYADHLPGRTVTLDGEEFLYFSGTSYLGMARNPAFLDLLREGMNRYGANYSSSRGGNLQLSVYDEAEVYLASCTGAPAALTVSSGMLAGQLVMKTLPEKAQFLYGPRTHPALWRTPADHYESPWQAWADRLPQQIEQIAAQQVIILTNALDPLQAESFHFDWVAKIPEGKQIMLIVDDSHGLGVTGRDGGGIYGRLAAFPNVQVVVVASLGKALSLPGGVVLADASLISEIRKQAFFGGASPVPPAYLYAFLQAGPLYEESRKRLLTNIQQFSHEVGQFGLFRHIPHFPVFYTQAMGLDDFLRERKMMISCFPYPTPDSDHITRVILSSLHEPGDITHLAQQLAVFRKNH
jgi:7-keto-8-aminopelargonate synthetase-like enzyme